MNGRLKQWQVFDKVVSNHYIPYIGELIRLVSVTCNKYPQLARKFPEDIKLAEEMPEKSKLGKHFQSLVQQECLLKKRAMYAVVDGSSDQLKNFPVLTEENYVKSPYAFIS